MKRIASIALVACVCWLAVSETAQARCGLFRKLFRGRSCSRASCATAQHVQTAAPVQKSPVQKTTPAVQKPTQKAAAGQQSYQRALTLAQETGEGQPILFVSGDGDAPAIARLISTLRAAGVDPPHIVDVAECDADLRQRALGAASGAWNGPFLQTFHRKLARTYEYGPTYYPLASMDSAAKYQTWLASNSRPLVQSNYTYTYYTYPYTYYYYYR